MVNLEFSEKRDSQFAAHFNADMDDITLVLRAHLLLEEMLRDFCAALLAQPRHLDGARLSFAQVLRLSNALYPTHIRIGEFGGLWSLGAKINKLRNTMAHSLEPEGDDLESQKSSIVKSVSAISSRQVEFTLRAALTFALGSFSALFQIAIADKDGFHVSDIPRRP